MKKVIVVSLALLLTSGLSFAGLIPANGDAWTEYSSASGMTAAGWVGASSTNLVASSDSVVGDYSNEASKDGNFQYSGMIFNDPVKTDISSAEGIEFYVKGTGEHVGHTFLFAVEMTRGTNKKKIHQTFPVTDEWAKISFAKDDPWTWTWDGGDKSWTELLAIKIYTGQSYTATSTDKLMIDGLNFVPEPSSMVLLGLGGLAAIRRRRK